MKQRSATGGQASPPARGPGKNAPGAAAAQAQRRTRPAVPGLWAFMRILLASRLLSAALNIVQDCDESYNFWDPLHFTIYGSGLQTWEHSPQFALRSALYLFLHKAIATPAVLLVGGGANKHLVFYSVRACLGATTAACEAALCAAAARRHGARLASFLCALLAGSAGLFSASTALLPSSFSMTLLCAASAACVARRHQLAVALCTVGPLLGWPFAGLAAVPFGLSALWHDGVLRTALTLALCAGCTLGLSLAADNFFYGRPTLSVLNLLKYNVAGGGDSALYGVEDALYYLRSGFLAFNNALPAALAALPAELVASLVRRRAPRWDLLAIVCSFYLWGGFMTAIPHKEERFLYVVYPQIALAAALSFDAAAEATQYTPGSGSWLFLVSGGVRLCAAAAVAGSVAVSCSRVGALLTGYSAPTPAFRAIGRAAAAAAADAAAATGTAGAPSAAGAMQFVCLGEEWYRFPSSFFLPGNLRPAFVNRGFTGMLPVLFDKGKGGAAHAPAGLNAENRAAPEQWIRDEALCAYWVGRAEERPPALGAGFHWERVGGYPLIDAAGSRGYTRSFWVPGVSTKKNKYTELLAMRRAAGDAPPWTGGGGAADGAAEEVLDDDKAATASGVNGGGATTRGAPPPAAAAGASKQEEQQHIEF